MVPFLGRKSRRVPTLAAGSTVLTEAKETFDDEPPPQRVVFTSSIITRARETSDDEGGFSGHLEVSERGTSKPFLVRYAQDAPGPVEGLTVGTKAVETADDEPPR